MTLDFTTGRDRLIVCRALAFAIVTIEKLPKEALGLPPICRT